MSHQRILCPTPDYEGSLDTFIEVCLEVCTVYIVRLDLWCTGVNLANQDWAGPSARLYVWMARCPHTTDGNECPLPSCVVSCSLPAPPRLALSVWPAVSVGLCVPPPTPICFDIHVLVLTQVVWFFSFILVFQTHFGCFCSFTSTHRF